MRKCLRDSNEDRAFVEELFAEVEDRVGSKVRTDLDLEVDLDLVQAFLQAVHLLDLVVVDQF